METHISDPGGRRPAPDPSPRLSVVIPVWNRAGSIRPCIDSCLTQDFEDFEVIVVDDASTDDTVAVVEACTDPRLRVVRHEQNRGVCPARGSGTRAARGRWIVFLDSDWSLEPGALRCLAGMAAEAPPDVGIVGGFVRMDTGVLSPRAAPPETPFGFVEYLHWLDTGQAGDWLSCWRREVFDQFSWPEDRRWELGFSVRVSVPWKRWITRQVLAVQSTQCTNRLTQDRSSAADQRKMSVAPALARDIDETLQRFGPEFAPTHRTC